jgi:hypothetical protein
LNVKKHLLMLALCFLACFAWQNSFAQQCTVLQAASITYGADNEKGVMFLARWCKPATRWLDYTSNCRAMQPSAMSALQQAQFMLALATRDESALPIAVDQTALFAACQAAAPIIAAARPPAPVIVAKNGTWPTRPVFDVDPTTGLRSSVAHASIRATVGARAACGLAMVSEGASTYCTWELPSGAWLPNKVTLVSEVK